MYSYRDQLEMLNGVRIKENQQTRIDCPFCGGRKTFGIARRDGKLMWNCFKASCGIRGVKDSEMSAETARRRMMGIRSKPQSRTEAIPPLLSCPRNHPKALEYLRSVNSLEAFDEGLVRVTYSPAQDRVLFHTQDGDGAVGRSLKGERPKWKVYGEVSGLFRVGSGRVAVLVEDVASACAVSRVSDFTGCAMLGTTLTANQRSILRTYDAVVIALDADASRKSLDIYMQLCASVRCFVETLADDLKWLDLSAMERALFKYTHVGRAAEDNRVTKNPERNYDESQRTNPD